MSFLDLDLDDVGLEVEVPSITELLPERERK
jgi:hypothetical protein